MGLGAFIGVLLLIFSPFSSSPESLTELKPEQKIETNPHLPPTPPKPTFLSLRLIMYDHIGDLYSAPEYYFPNIQTNMVGTVYLGWIKTNWEEDGEVSVQFNENVTDQIQQLIRNDTIIIVSGGAMLNVHWQWDAMLEDVSSQFADNLIVLWSAGLNCDDSEMFALDGKTCLTNFKYTREYPWELVNFLDNFDLVRLRDRVGDSPHPTLLDATCLMPELKERFEISRRVGLYGYYDCPEFIEENTNLAAHVLHEDQNNVQAIIKFIGESEVIVTGTYHGLYWSLLLGKKVVICRRDLSIELLTFPVQFVTWSGDFEADVERAPIYPYLMDKTIRQHQEFFVLILKTFQNHIGFS